MTEDREKISTGPNEEPINETIAGTGPGISDDSLAPGEDEPPRRRPMKRSRRWPRSLALRQPRKTRFRWKVNESRLFEDLDSVIVQFRSLHSAS